MQLWLCLGLPKAASASHTLLSLSAAVAAHLLTAAAARLKFLMGLFIVFLQLFAFRALNGCRTKP